MSNKKRVLVYPCGTEIGLEIFRAVHLNKNYELIGGSSTYDHGRFVYRDHIDQLPYITDDSGSEIVREFAEMIRSYQIDFLYPAMDGVLTVFSKYRQYFECEVIAPEYETCQITRSKRKTYELLKDIVRVPAVYDNLKDIKKFPVFIKPDIGQGSVGARKIEQSSQLPDGAEIASGQNLICEYLPGMEYTVDCFTNIEGKLVCCAARKRKRIKAGISVNAIVVEHPQLNEIAKKINKSLRQKGGWFFQVKEAEDGTFVILEIASRIAGASSYARCRGMNLPLLTLDLYRGWDIQNVLMNDVCLELDRALYNAYQIQLYYNTIYVDFDDTLVIDDKINVSLIGLLFQAKNENKKIVLLTKHVGDLMEALNKYCISELFDDIKWLDVHEQKKDYIVDEQSIFIDDSYGERKAVAENCGIPVFDIHMIECLKNKGMN